MLVAGGRLDLLHEAVGAQDCGELRAQYLDRDLAVVIQFLGEVDCRHAALTEFTLDAITTAVGGSQPGIASDISSAPPALAPRRSSL